MKLTDSFPPDLVRLVPSLIVLVVQCMLASIVRVSDPYASSLGLVGSMAFAPITLLAVGVFLLFIRQNRRVVNVMFILAAMATCLYIFT